MSAFRKSAKKNVSEIDAAAARLEGNSEELQAAKKALAEATSQKKQAEKTLAEAKREKEKAEAARKEAERLRSSSHKRREATRVFFANFPESVMDMLDEIAKYGTSKKDFVLENIVEPARKRYAEIQKMKKK